MCRTHITSALMMMQILMMHLTQNKQHNMLIHFISLFFVVYKFLKANLYIHHYVSYKICNKCKLTIMTSKNVFIFKIRARTITYFRVFVIWCYKWTQIIISQNFDANSKENYKSAQYWTFWLCKKSSKSFIFFLILLRFSLLPNIPFFSSSFSTTANLSFDSIYWKK